MSRLISFLLFCAMACLSPTVHAKDAGHVFSLTISPIHLAAPIVELTGEVRLPVDFSVAGIAGVGSIDGTTAWEAGAQARYYLLGGFEHGMPLGVEALFIQVEDRSGNISGTGQGLAVGPFIGYKFASDEGFTIDLGAGVQFAAVRAKATDADTGTTASAQGTEIFPLINLNLGWSF
jgi:hypothetical protein